MTTKERSHQTPRRLKDSDSDSDSYMNRASQRDSKKRETAQLIGRYEILNERDISFFFHASN